MEDGGMFKYPGVNTSCVQLVSRQRLVAGNPDISTINPHKAEIHVRQTIDFEMSQKLPRVHTQAL